MLFPLLGRAARLLVTLKRTKHRAFRARRDRRAAAVNESSRTPSAGARTFDHWRAVT